MEELVADFIQPVAVVVCYCICYVINQTCGEGVKRFVPLIAALLGVACCVVTNIAGGITTDTAVQVVAQGLVSGLAATGVWELYKGVLKSA